MGSSPASAVARCCGDEGRDAGVDGADVHNVPVRRTPITEIVAAETPLDQGVAQTVARFRELLAKGLVSAP